MRKLTTLLLAGLLLFATVSVTAQSKETPRSGYRFKVLSEIKTTPVKDQQSVGTCWDYATVSLLETELLRKGKEEVDLSELFVAKNCYAEKGIRYVRFHGNTNFSEGGQAHDVIDAIRKHGIVPEEVYTGLQYGRKFHIHGELVAALRGMLDGINKNPNKELTPVWPLGMNAFIETYLGKTPEVFTYRGKSYTPQEYAASLELKWDDYIELTSFEAYPFYEAVVLPMPDNWLHGHYYNLPLEELMEVMTHALIHGFSIAWDGDVSHSGFNHRNGLAILPTDQPEEMTGAEIDKWQAMSPAERKAKITPFVSPAPEMKVDDARRQQTFNSRVTTDDHLMHITGLAQDQYGTLYFNTKNSWNAASNDFGGYLYMSEQFVRLQTVAIMIHKDALPKHIRKKLHL